MSHFVLTQIIGLIAVGISLCVFQTNKRQTMLLLSMSAAILYTIHFFLLGAATGAAMNLIGAGRCYVYFKAKPKKGQLWIPLGFIVISTIGAIVTWQGLLSLLPLFGSVSTGIAFWQKNPKYIRRLNLISSPLWFSYDGISGSYPGMLIETIVLCSNLVGMYRFDFRAKQVKAL